MNAFRVLVLIAICFLAGCSTTYVIRLNNSDQIIAKSRPRLVRGFYVFKDINGQEVRISDLKVREIEAK